MRDWLVATFGIDPVMRKESFGISRRWQTYFARSAYVGILAFIVWCIWLSYQWRGRMDYSAYSQLGAAIFLTFSVLQFIVMSLAAIGTASDMITREVREKTLGILALTPLGAWRIVLGKWKFAVAHHGVILLAGVPVLSLGLFLQGASIAQFAGILALTLAMTMMCAAFGMLCSSLTRTSSNSSRMLAVVGMAAWALFLPLLNVMLPYSMQFSVRIAAGYVHPAFALAPMLGAWGPPPDWAWVPPSLTSIALAFAFLMLAALRVRAIARLDPGASMERRLIDSMDRVFDRTPLAMRASTDAAGVWDFNPYLWKEMRSRVVGRIRWFVGFAAFLLLVLVVILTFVGRNVRDEGIIGTIYSILASLVMLLSVGAGAGGFTREKEEKSWEILLTTPIRPGQLVWAKLLGGMLSVSHLVLVLVAFTVIALFAQPRALTVPMLVATLVFSFFTVSAGLLFSVHVQSTRRAYSNTLGLVMMFVVGIPIMVMIMAAVARWGRGTDELVAALLRATNPYAHVQPIFDRSMRDPGAYVAGFIVFCGAYAAMGWACLAMCRAHVNRLLGRVR